jgi:hypothetical protein
MLCGSPSLLSRLDPLDPLSHLLWPRDAHHSVARAAVIFGARAERCHLDFVFKGETGEILVRALDVGALRAGLGWPGYLNAVCRHTCPSHLRSNAGVNNFLLLGLDDWSFKM